MNIREDIILILDERFVPHLDFSRWPTDDLAMLWKCLRGFQMFQFEGHIPGEPTYLKNPPSPFTSFDYAQKRKDSIFEDD